MTAFWEQHAKLQKPAPRAIGRQDRKRDEDRVYRENSAKAKERDGHRCRICGKHFGLETHHVQPRSLNRRSKSKHDVNRLLTVCGPSTDIKTCHGQFQAKTLKVYPNTDRGTDGPCLVERWSKDEGGFVLAMRNA